MSQQNWEEIVAKKRTQVAACLPEDWRLKQSIIDEAKANPTAGVMHIPAQCGLLTPKEVEITENYDAVELIQLMASKKLTSYQVTLAFCKRAAIAQQLINCLTEMFFDKALERAKFLDEYLEKNGKTLGPFHGLPISLKDMANVKGTYTTIGYVSWIKDEPVDYNSYLVDILLEQGAVFYAKTNVPQTMMVGETVNNVFGRTLNPHNLNLTVGGSSGGEGALVGFRGSPLGVGTDIGGSIRIPSLCCGTYGFRPTSKRIPNGLFSTSGRYGSPGFLSVVGPLANSTRDLRYFLENVIAARPWDRDPGARVVPWRPVEKKTSLRIGFLLEDKNHRVTPPIRRALTEAVKKIQAAGHNVVPVEGQPSLDETTETAFAFFSLDTKQVPYQYILDSGEPPVPPIAELYEVSYVPKTPRTIDDVYNLNVKKADLNARWHGVFVKGNLDVILMPGFRATAVPHDTYGIPHYTLVWNLLDYPAVILPFQNADRSIDVAVKDIPDYKPDEVHGLPGHVQIVARSEHDEELMWAVDLIEKALRTGTRGSKLSSL